MKTNTIKQFTWIMALTSLVNCGAEKLSDNPLPPPAPPTPDLAIALKKVASCDELLGQFKSKLIKQQEATLDFDNMKDKLCMGEGEVWYSPTAADEGSNTFTQTNLAEANVDEPDIMKTNGKNIFVTHLDGIDIFNAWPATKVNLVTTLKMDPLITSKTLSQTKKLSPVNPGSYEQTHTFSARPQIMLNGNELILLGTADYNSTRIVLVDISDVATPAIIKDITFNGALTDARIVNHILHAVFSNYGGFKGQLDTVDYKYSLIQDFCGDDATLAGNAESRLRKNYGETLEKNTATIQAAKIADFDLPAFTKEGVEKPVDCTDFADDQSGKNSMATVYSLNLAQPSQDETTVVNGTGYYIYASTDSLYLTSQTGDNWWGAEDEKSVVHRFGLGSGTRLHTYQATGSVPGHILNSFSLGEYEGHLRIATTSGFFGAETSNQVYVLDATNPTLPIVGSIEDIAKGESIYGVRFLGTRGYVVTFKKIDPLFVLDLQDPANPTIAGELKMPGYSTYIHPINSRLVLGIGKDAEDMGSFAWFQGVKLALFDISNPAKPSIVDEVIIGDRGTTSDAIYNHHAFTYDATTGLLALPISYYAGIQDENNEGDFEYNGFHVYQITPQGISEKAIIKSDTQVSEGMWWDDDNDRTILVNGNNANYLYGLQNSSLTTVDLNAPSNILSEATLTEDITAYPMYY